MSEYRNILARAAQDLGSLPAAPQGYGASLTMPSPNFVPAMPTRWNVLARLMGDPVSSQAEEQRGFHMANLLSGFAGTASPGSGQAARGIRAFHGSPHRFDRFDMSRIGTGEGAQVYGHGLYFAGNEDVARGYRDVLAGRTPPRITAIRPDWMAANDYAQAMDELRAFGAQHGRRPQIDEVSSNAGRLLGGGYIENWRTGRPAGTMYEVNLRVDPARLLNWDAPLSAQPQAVRDFLAANNLRLPNRERGQGIYAEIGARIRTPGQTGPLEIYRNAAEQLRQGGIPGLQYFDAGSRSAGAGTRNYVMFDDSLIDILRRYGIAGLGVGLGAGAAQQ